MIAKKLFVSNDNFRACDHYPKDRVPFMVLNAHCWSIRLTFARPHCIPDIWQKFNDSRYPRYVRLNYQSLMRWYLWFVIEGAEHGLRRHHHRHSVRGDQPAEDIGRRPRGHQHAPHHTLHWEQVRCTPGIQSWNLDSCGLWYFGLGTWFGTSE